MEKIAKNKWKIAALTLVTFPLSFFASMESEKHGYLIIFIGLSPLLFAVSIEFIAEIVSDYQHYKQTGVFPDSKIEGSPVGNKIAVVLAILFAVFFVFPLIWVMVSSL